MSSIIPVHIDTTIAPRQKMSCFKVRCVHQPCIGNQISLTYYYTITFTVSCVSPFSFSLPALGSMTVDPTTVRPDSSAALATALAKSASAKNEPSLESAPLAWTELQLESLLSVTLAQDANMEPGRGITNARYQSQYTELTSVLAQLRCPQIKIIFTLVNVTSDVLRRYLLETGSSYRTLVT